MVYKQLVEPDLSITEKSGLCLQFTESSFNTPHLYDSAWQAWESAQFKHQDRNFLEGMSFPVYFDWTGSVQWTDGTWRTARYGHIAYHYKDGKIYSSPLTGYGRAWFNTVDDLVRAFGNGMKYVGWSEDLAGLRIIEEEDNMITKEQYLVGAEAVGTEYGRDFNFNPNRTVDDFVNFLNGQAPIITTDMERKLADQVTGYTSVIGKDYNSPFVGKKVATDYPKMVAFWLGQPRKQVSSVASVDKNTVIDYVSKNLK